MLPEHLSVSPLVDDAPATVFLSSFRKFYRIVLHDELTTREFLRSLAVLLAPWLASTAVQPLRVLRSTKAGLTLWLRFLIDTTQHRV